MPDCLFVKIYEADIKNNKDSQLSLVPGKELKDAKTIKQLLDNAIKVYKPKKNEQRTFESCRQLRDLFDSNSTQAMAQWNSEIQTAQKEYEKQYNEQIAIMGQNQFTQAEVNLIQSNLPLWDIDYIKKKLDKKFIDFGSDPENTIVDLPEDKVFFARWNTFLSYQEKCCEKLKKNGITVSSGIMSWMDILRYWKFISPLFDINPQMRKEDNYTGYNTTTASGLSSLKQQFRHIFQENRSNSSLNGREYQRELEEVCKFMEDCCKSVTRFENYKNRLDIVTHESIREKILLLCNKNTKVIHNYKRAIEIATDAKVNDPALFVNRVLADSGIMIPAEGKTISTKAAPKTKRCPNCGAYNDESFMACSCGYTLQIQCPKCKKTVSVEQSKCVYCGFEIGNYSKADSEIKLAQQALVKEDLEECEKHLLTANMLWSNHPQISSIQEQFDKFREQKNKSLVQKYLNSLTIPGKAMIMISQEHVKITWSRCSCSITIPKEYSIQYLVIRKENAIPSNAHDGKTLTMTSDLSYEDTTLIPGQIYGYAVFPCINKVPSNQGYSGSKAMSTCGVSKLKATPANNMVKLSWEMPEKAIKIRIYRKLGSDFTKISLGELLEELTPCNGFTDTKVKTGQKYSYIVVPVFNGISGLSEGKFQSAVECVPCTPPSIVVDLRHSNKTSCNCFEWTPSKSGTVKLYISSSPLGTQGESLSITDSAFSRSIEITESDSNRGYAEYRGNLSNVQFITPVSFNNVVGVIGKAIQISNIKDVSNVHLTRTNGKIYVSWDWDSSDKEFCILYRHDKFPASPNDSVAKKVIVTRSLYDMEKAYIVNSVGNDNYFFSIFRFCNVNGEKKYSSPAQCKSIGKKTVVAYSFYKRKRWLFFGECEYWLNIKVESPTGQIPDLILVSKKNAQPFRRNDGVKIMDIPGSGNRTQDIKIPSGKIDPEAKYKLFIKQKSEEELYSINDPNNMRF